MAKRSFMPPPPSNSGGREFLDRGSTPKHKITNEEKRAQDEKVKSQEKSENIKLNKIPTYRTEITPNSSKPVSDAPPLPPVGLESPKKVPKVQETEKIKKRAE